MLKKSLINWYYPRGTNSPKWRKKYFYKYGSWLWDEELLEAEISHIDRILYMLRPYNSPILTYLQNKYK